MDFWRLSINMHFENKLWGRKLVGKFPFYSHYFSCIYVYIFLTVLTVLGNFKKLKTVIILNKIWKRWRKGTRRFFFVDLLCGWSDSSRVDGAGPGNDTSVHKLHHPLNQAHSWSLETRARVFYHFFPISPLSLSTPKFQQVFFRVLYINIIYYSSC